MAWVLLVTATYAIANRYILIAQAAPKLSAASGERGLSKGRLGLTNPPIFADPRQAVDDRISCGQQWNEIELRLVPGRGEQGNST